jgi:hypothetical protein
MNKQLLELFEEHIYFPEDHTKVCWTENYGTISYNKENNVEDLLDGNGETYSGEVREDLIEIDGYVMYLLDSSCGFDYQAIFSLALKVGEDE